MWKKLNVKEKQEIYDKLLDYEYDLIFLKQDLQRYKADILTKYWNEVYEQIIKRVNQYLDNDEMLH